MPDPGTASSLQITAACPGLVTANATFTTMLAASGGGSPYTWTVNGPPWIMLTSATGIEVSVTGTPPAAGTFPFTVTLSDNAGSTPAPFPCTVQVNAPKLPPLQIDSTGCPAGPIDVGANVSVTLTGSGGQMPYTWVPNLPTWLALNATTGMSVTVSGKAAPSTGTVSFTVGLDDSAGSPSAPPFTCRLTINPPVIPPVTITPLTPTIKVTDPQTVTIGLSAPTPVTLDGVLQLTFTPNAFGVTDNPQVVFVNNTRLARFQIPAGSTQMVPAPMLMQQGTIAGTIRIEVISLLDGDRDVLPANHPFSELVIPRSAPVLGDVMFDNETANGFDVVISGYSTPRDMVSATLTFTPSQDATIEGSSTFTIPTVAEKFMTFYQSSKSMTAGSSFMGLRLPVSIEGDKTAIGAVTVSLTNTAGTSAAITTKR